jgi:hypothetical protein
MDSQKILVNIRTEVSFKTKCEECDNLLESRHVYTEGEVLIIRVSPCTKCDKRKELSVP